MKERERKRERKKKEIKREKEEKERPGMSRVTPCVPRDARLAQEELERCPPPAVAEATGATGAKMG